MQIRIILLTLCTLLLIARPAFAQEDIPWPPDTDTLFTDAVEIVDSTDVIHFSGFDLDSLIQCTESDHGRNRTPPYIPLYTGDKPIFIFDRERAAIYLYRGSEVQITEWPLLATQSPSLYCQRSDGMVVIDTSGYIYSPGYRELSAENVWLYHPETGELSQPELLCETLRDLPGEGRWVVVPRQPNAPEYRLCFTENGEQTAPITSPDGEEWANLWALATSPDKQWAVLINGGCDDPTYGYHVQTGRIISLSTPDSNHQYESQCYFERWLDERRFLFYIDERPEWSGRHLVIGDVTQSESLETLISGWRFGAEFYDNPPRYELIPGLTRQGHGWGASHCVLQVFDFNSQRLSEYELGNLCTPNVTVPNHSEIRIFRAVELDLTQHAVLASYNLQTRTRTDLYTGEIEHVFSTSPDGRYIVLLVDNNGLIDNIPDYDWTAWTELGDPQIAIYDTDTDAIVYTFSARGLAVDSYLIDEIEFQWLSSDQFVMIGVDGSGGGEISLPRRYVRFVWITDQRHHTLDSVSDFQLSPDGEHLLYVSRALPNAPLEEWTEGVYILNFTTGDTTNIMSETPLYTAWVHWQSAELINVTVISEYQHDYNSFIPRGIRYTLRLNQGDP